ncbi:MAG: hypothetical protein ACK5IQ_01625 [Bacteroidales bacterium]
MRTRIKHLLGRGVVAIAILLIANIFLKFFDFDSNSTYLLIGLAVLLLILYFIIPDKKILVDENDNAIRKEK